MPWLRLDDAYDTHPKLLQLTELQRWRWTRALLYCARHRTAGILTRAALSDLALTRSVSKLVELGLLIEDDERFVVHDWDDYNPKDPTSAQRQARWRNRNASRNGDERDETVTSTVTSAVTEASLARGRARADPSRPLERDKSLSHGVTLDDDSEADRRAAWEQRAAAPDVRSPAAFARSGIESGEWPDGYVEPREQRGVNMPVTVPVCPECGVSPPLHTADCSLAS